MFRNVVNNILYALSLIFLSGSIYVYIFNNDSFSINALFGTDGLTFFGLLIALIMMISMKIPFIRKFIGFILLTINFSQVDYRLIAIMTTSENYLIDNLISALLSTVESSSLYKDSSYKTYRKTSTSVEMFHRGMAANIMIKRLANDEIDRFTAEDDGVANRWKVEIDGVSPFRIVSKNTKFLTNTLLEHLNSQLLIPIHISLNISSKNTEYNLADKGILLDRKRYPLGQSNVEIDSKNSSKIIINSSTGISLSARNRGDFSNAFDTFKNIIVS